MASSSLALAFEKPLTGFTGCVRRTLVA